MKIGAREITETLTVIIRDGDTIEHTVFANPKRKLTLRFEFSTPPEGSKGGIAWDSAKDDPDVMLVKLSGWKPASGFVNRHMINPGAFWRPENERYYFDVSISALSNLCALFTLNISKERENA
jgi:hypothetical protein